MGTLWNARWFDFVECAVEDLQSMIMFGCMWRLLDGMHCVYFSTVSMFLKLWCTYRKLEIEFTICYANLLLCIHFTNCCLSYSKDLHNLTHQPKVWQRTSICFLLILFAHKAFLHGGCEKLKYTWMYIARLDFIVCKSSYVYPLNESHPHWFRFFFFFPIERSRIQINKIGFA